VDTSHGRVVTTLDQKIKLDTNIDGLSTANNRANQLTEYVTTTTVANGDDVSATTVNLNYIVQDGSFRDDGRMAFGWTYAAQAEQNGTAGDWVRISDLYTTVRGSYAARQQYVAFDSAGNCYDRTLDADITQRKPAITGVSDGDACSSLVGLSVSPAGSEAAGVDVALTATLDSAASSGRVEFFDGGVLLGSAPVVAGQAVLATNALPVGERSLTARYVSVDVAGASLSSDLPVAVPYTVTAGLAGVDIGSKCIAGKAYLTVTASNDTSAPVSLEVATPYGVKVFSGIAPGTSGFHSFTTRLASYSDVPVVVTALESGGAARTGTYTVAASASCG
jgi:hypothetical protein